VKHFGSSSKKNKNYKMTDNNSRSDSEHIEPYLYQINNLPVKKKRRDQRTRQK